MKSRQVAGCIIGSRSPGFGYTTFRSSRPSRSVKLPFPLQNAGGVIVPSGWLFVGALDTVDHFSSRRIFSAVTYSYLVAGMT